MDFNFIAVIGAWIAEHGGETVVGLTGLIAFFSLIANFTKTRTAATWGSVPTWDTFGTGSPTGTSDGFAPVMVMRWTPS